jgi:hypothetical protein
LDCHGLQTVPYLYLEPLETGVKVEAHVYEEAVYFHFQWKSPFNSLNCPMHGAIGEAEFRKSVFGMVRGLLASGIS